MKNLRYIGSIVFIAISVTNSYGQIPVSVPEFELPGRLRRSSDIFSLPQNIENYSSLRLKAMGIALRGIVSDDLTDMFRNPAFVSERGNKSYYLDYEDRSASNSLRVSLFSSLLSGKMGLSISGDEAVRNSLIDDTDQINDFPGASTLTSLRISNSSSKYYDVHIWWAKKLSNDRRLGINYIFGNSELSSAGNSKSTFISNRILPFDQRIISDSRIDVSNSTTERKTGTNTFRSGMIFGSPDSRTIDIVAKVEFTNINIERSSERIRDRYYSTMRPDYLRQSQYVDSVNSIIDSDIDALVYGIEMNMKNPINDDVIEIYFLSVDRVGFNVSDNIMQFSSNVNNTIRDSLFTDRQNIFSSETNANRNDASGYNLRLGWGREVTNDKATIGFGINAKSTTGSWDNVWVRTSSGISDFSDNDTTYQLSFSLDSNVVISSEFSSMSLRFPVGGEFYVTNFFSIRFGIEFNAIYTKSESSIPSGTTLRKSERSSLGNRKSFGLGYRHSDKFRADLLAGDDLSRLSSWRVAIQYGL